MLMLPFHAINNINKALIMQKELTLHAPGMSLYLLPRCIDFYAT